MTDEAFTHAMGQPFDGKGKVFAPAAYITEDGRFFAYDNHPGEGMPMVLYACLGYTPEPDS